MFHVPAVLILGAGASNEVGLPLGKELAAKISKLVDFRFEHGVRMVSGDADLYSIIKQKFGSNVNEYRRAGAFIASGIQLADSIDDFLSLHQSDKKITIVGKLGIAKAILAAERKSGLCPRGDSGEETVDFKSLNDTWFVKLLKILSRDVRRENVEAFFTNVSFVNFNYDRCLEFFFWRSLQQLYGVNEHKAAEIVSHMKVFRPYGSVGALKMTSGGSGIKFAEENSNCLAASSGIRTYSEKIDENDDLELMRAEIGKAKLIVFLGIHFHEQNIKLITPKKATAENIFGTARNFSDEDRSVVEGQLGIFLARKYRDGNFVNGDAPIRLQNLTCSQLFDRYSKTLPRPTPIEPVNFSPPRMFR
jgi:hypothetical protein